MTSSSAGAGPVGAHQPKRLRDRLPAFPLRTRMLVAMTALVACVCLVVGAISLVLLREYLINQLDAQLFGAGNRMVSAANRPAPPPNAPNAPNQPDDSDDDTPPEHGHSHHSGIPFGRAQQVGTLSAIIHHGELQRAGVLDKDGYSRVLGDDDDLLRVPADGRPRTRSLDGLGEYRLFAVPASDDRVFVIGLPFDAVNETLASLAVIELTVAGGGLVLAGLVSTLVVRVTLRPLSRVAATAGRVAEHRLDRGEVALAERVGDRDTDPRTEVGQVGAALNRMLEHVASALAARQASETQLRQFIADASHELRTPLAAIRGYAELTRRSGEENMPPDVAHSLRRITSQAERMTALVEDMFLLARLDSGRPLAREPVDLSQLVVDALSDAHAAGVDHRWTLRLPEEAVVVPGDATRLAQVLSNLLTNARVHTPPGTTVLAELVGEPDAAVVRVVDDGPGISPALLPQVFGRFARGDSSRSRAAGSTGLGLAIAHAVVVAHGGEVSVRSVPGETVFTVRLPYRVPRDTNGASAVSLDSGGADTRPAVAASTPRRSGAGPSVAPATES